MLKADMRLINWQDIPAAAGLLTRLPVRIDTQWAQARGAQAAWAYPLVGLALGAATVGLAVVLLALGAPAALSAGLCVAAMVIITGAMHEDGLADAADGFWGGWTPARRLEIMKDSHIGAYGVIALGLGLGLKWLCVTALLEAQVYWPLPAVACASRAAMVGLMWGLPGARATGLSRAVGAVPGRTFALAILLSALALAPLGAGGVLAGLGILTAAWACARISSAKIGGQTGDVLGATQVITELVGLTVLICLL